MSADIHQDLKSLTERALDTQEFTELRGATAVISAEARTTTIPGRALRLPLPYVCRVIELARDSSISMGKAAQMFMIDKKTLFERFGNKLEEAAV